MYKIGVIGDPVSVVGFKAVGLDVFPCEEGREARKLIRRLAESEYAILYITEDLAEEYSNRPDHREFHDFIHSASDYEQAKVICEHNGLTVEEACVRFIEATVACRDLPFPYTQQDIEYAKKLGVTML